MAHTMNLIAALRVLESEIGKEATIKQLEVLTYIVHNKQVTLADISNYCGVVFITARNMCVRLGEGGGGRGAALNLVEKQDNPQDARQKFIVPTQKGKDLIKRVLKELSRGSKEKRK